MNGNLDTLLEDLLKGVPEWADQNNQRLPCQKNCVVTTPFDLKNWPFCAGNILRLKLSHAALEIGRDDP